MTSFPKQKRVVNQKVLDEARRQPCRCCNSPGADPHHVTSRKAGGGDTHDNVIPLCRKHHVMWHKEGVGRMYDKFQGVRDWLWIMRRTDVVDKIKRITNVSSKGTK